MSLRNHPSNEKCGQKGDWQTQQFVMLLPDSSGVQIPDAAGQGRAGQAQYQKEPQVFAVNEVVQNNPDWH